MAGESDSISSEAFLRSAEEDSGEQTDRSRKGQCGKSVFEGIAIGKIRLIRIKKRNIVCIHVEDVESEIARKNQAVEETDIQLRMLYEKAMPEIGEEKAAIFEVHRMMLRDSYYQETIENIIRSQGVNAEYAVGEHC